MYASKANVFVMKKLDNIPLSSMSECKTALKKYIDARHSFVHIIISGWKGTKGDILLDKYKQLSTIFFDLLPDGIEKCSFVFEILPCVSNNNNNSLSNNNNLGGSNNIYLKEKEIEISGTGSCKEYRRCFIKQAPQMVVASA